VTPQDATRGTEDERTCPHGWPNFSLMHVTAKTPVGLLGTNVRRQNAASLGSAQSRPARSLLGYGRNASSCTPLTRIAASLVAGAFLMALRICSTCRTDRIAPTPPEFQSCCFASR